MKEKAAIKVSKHPPKKVITPRKSKIVPSNNLLTIITFSSCLAKDTET